MQIGHGLMHWVVSQRGADMAGRAPGFFDVDDRLVELSAKGDGLERVNALVDFEMFRPALEAAIPRADRSKGGRPPFDHVIMFKVLILQAMHSLSDERCEFLIKDRLSFMRFLSNYSPLFLGRGFCGFTPGCRGLSGRGLRL
jgi:hypothetical protein